MKVKPKDVLVNLPIALLFDEPWEIASFAANINTILHGKVRLKSEDLGRLGGRYVGLFYLQRNNECQEIRDEFVRLIEQEEQQNHMDSTYVPASKVVAASDNEPHCRQVPECDCGVCRDPYGGHKP